MVNANDNYKNEKEFLLSIAKRIILEGAAKGLYTYMDNDHDEAQIELEFTRDLIKESA